MLAYLTIVEDIANGHTFMEYEGKWYGYDYAIVLEKDSLTFYFEDEQYVCMFGMDVNDFLNFKWYKDYIKHIQATLYYNIMEKLYEE